ncbi:unnamed protein product [Arabidopsis thaliana]|uniref:(thale cress) hypothetical protein n=1 Tax=Arabidopsis thaliana TaxID=3702 RepID=A0A7G2DY81_ARATH|nr:unnamed protein product [Arabidopsis thaliana]
MILLVSYYVLIGDSPLRSFSFVSIILFAPHCVVNVASSSSVKFQTLPTKTLWIWILLETSSVKTICYLALGVNSLGSLGLVPPFVSPSDTYVAFRTTLAALVFTVSPLHQYDAERFGFYDPLVCSAMV